MCAHTQISRDADVHRAIAKTPKPSPSTLLGDESLHQPPAATPAAVRKRVDGGGGDKMRGRRMSELVYLAKQSSGAGSKSDSGHGSEPATAKAVEASRVEDGGMSGDVEQPPDVLPFSCDGDYVANVPPESAVGTQLEHDGGNGGAGKGRGWVTGQTQPPLGTAALGTDVPKGRWLGDQGGTDSTEEFRVGEVDSILSLDDVYKSGAASDGHGSWCWPPPISDAPTWETRPAEDDAVVTRITEVGFTPVEPEQLPSEVQRTCSCGGSGNDEAYAVVLERLVTTEQQVAELRVQMQQDAAEMQAQLRTLLDAVVALAGLAHVPHNEG